VLPPVASVVAAVGSMASPKDTGVAWGDAVLPTVGAVAALPFVALVCLAARFAPLSSSSMRASRKLAALVPFVPADAVLLPAVALVAPPAAVAAE